MVRRQHLLLYGLFHVLLCRVEFLLEELDFANKTVVCRFAVFTLRSSNLGLGKLSLCIFEFFVEDAYLVLE